MNINIARLIRIAGEKQRTIIGLMSGTSLDGLDIALCQVEGSGINTKLTVQHFETIAYDDDIRSEIRSIFAQQNISLEKLCLLNSWIALQHAAMINACLQKWGIAAANVDIIASHGQTIYHAPKRLHEQEKFGNATLQIGDGDHLAVATGIITISDLRQKEIALGGEGAPLALYGDSILFGKKDEDRILLNIGGIANLTFLPADENKKTICTDLGPGNTMMDAFVQQHFPGKYFDHEAAIAKAGKVNEHLLMALKDNDFFQQPFPKTTGPELFNLTYLQVSKVKATTADLPVADIMATLNQFTADIIVEGIKKIAGERTNVKIYSSGGGMHNPLLMQRIQNSLPQYSFYTTDELGINPDAKEAVLFAVLANECICGDGIHLGKICFPS